jgi:hypothetical protein
MLNKYFVSAIAIATVLILLLVLLFGKSGSKYVPPALPLLVKTADFETLKKVAKAKIAQVKRESSILMPYNSHAMSLCERAVEKSSFLSELGAAFLLLPNNGVGTYPLAPLTGPPEDTTLFQFEQGTIGWYWGYTTFLNPIANIMYYIVRIDLGTPEVRAKYNLPLGSTTLYSISVGVGTGKGTWKYLPYVTCRGTYKMDGKTSFRFTGSWGMADGNHGDGSIKFQTTDTGFYLECKSEEPDEEFTVVSNIDKSGPAYFNGAKGCAPCTSGLGTLYWSYPDLTGKATITIGANGKAQSFQKGQGWLDRQWMRGNDPQQLLVTLLSNITQLSEALGGLGRYVWINLHLPGVQYLIASFPGPNVVIKEGQSYNTLYRTYTKGKRAEQKPGSLTFKKTIRAEGITFPVVVEIKLEDASGKKQTYTIDSQPFGECVTIDITGNLHWSGSAIIEGHDKSSAFIELSQFQLLEDYRLNTLRKAGLPPDQPLAAFVGAPLTLSQAIPSVIVLALGPVLLLAALIFVVLGVRKSKK